MKTFNQIKELNYNDISFFLGIPVIDAKFIVECKAYPLSHQRDDNIKIGIQDYIEIKHVEKPIHSNSALDGKGVIETVVKTYNKGVTPHRFMEFGQNKSFIKAIKFTGKYAILNDILNADQYSKLQRIWLFSDVYGKKRWSKKTAIFIRVNDWALEYLESRGIENVNEKVLEVI